MTKTYNYTTPDIWQGKMDTKQLERSNLLDEVAYILDQTALNLQKLGLVYAGQLVMRAADNVASEAAFIADGGTTK
jgi:hypothetical protein